MEKIDKNKLLSPYEVISLYLFKKSCKNMIKGELDTYIPLEQDIDNWNYFVDSCNKDIGTNKERYIKRVIWGKDKKSQLEIERLNESGKFEEYINSEFLKNGIDLGFYYYKEQYKGENDFGIEIKNDKVLKNTGNIYIEYQERHTENDKWHDSGILKKDNSKYWLIGDIGEYYIIEKQKLLELYRNKEHEGLKEHKTSKGFIITIKKHKDIITATDIKDFVERLCDI